MVKRGGGLGASVFAIASPGGRRARLLIFTFHRVLTEPDPLLPGEPSVKDFARTAAWIADFCNVLPLPEATVRLADDSLPPRAACITFDDGYTDVEQHAVPVLRSLGLPATVFVAVDAVRVGIMWNDLVLDAIRHAGTSVDLSALGISERKAAPRADLAALANCALDALKYRPPAERWCLATTLHEVATNRRKPRRHMLTSEGIRRLAEAGFDIGGHTVSHPILTSLPDAAAWDEIESCYRWITSVTGREPTCFAYPNGRPGRDYDQRHVDMVRRAGYRVAVSTQWNCARRGGDPYQLPRFAPWERTRTAFLARLVRTCISR